MRDMIWLQVDERLEETGTVELRKSELAIQRERVRIILSILSDIRHIHLAMMPFKNDLAFHDFLTTLPSFKGDAKKEKAERRWKVKKRKPGEEPAWKKKIVDTENKS